MRYEIGDKVRLVASEEIRQDIKEWMEGKNWIATIKKVEENYKYHPVKHYEIEEAPCFWEPKDIEDYADPINSRFEILDL